MPPKQVMELWLELFNAADADSTAALYHDNAINHQVAIRAMFARDFAAAAMACVPEGFHEAGDVVALEWSDPLGLRGCGFFTIKNGLIAFQRSYWDKLSFLKMHGLPSNSPPWPTHARYSKQAPTVENKPATQPLRIKLRGTISFLTSPRSA
jgi:hypothetical protein